MDMSMDKIMQGHYERLSTMKRINRAADDPAGLAVVKKLEAQKNGYDTGARNGDTAGDLLKTAEGALSSIQDSLGRIRELGIKASNGIYTDSDRAYMQEEIEGLKASIQDAAKGTEFNTMKLLDGSRASLHVALNPDGSGKEIALQNTTLEALGIRDFDVTRSFDLKTIDEAIKKVSESRGNIGAAQNALAFSTGYNRLASQSLTESQSRLEDLDVGKAVSDMQKDKVMQEYQHFATLAKIKSGQLDINKMLGLQ